MACDIGWTARTAATRAISVLAGIGWNAVWLKVNLSDYVSCLMDQSDGWLVTKQETAIPITQGYVLTGVAARYYDPGNFFFGVPLATSASFVQPDGKSSPKSEN